MGTTSKPYYALDLTVEYPHVCVESDCHHDRSLDEGEPWIGDFATGPDALAALDEMRGRYEQATIVRARVLRRVPRDADDPDDSMKFEIVYDFVVSADGVREEA